MKPFLIFLLILLPAVVFAQEEKELHIQGIVVDANKRPIPDVYVINHIVFINMFPATMAFSIYLFYPEIPLFFHMFPISGR